MKHHICTPDLASWAAKNGCDYQGEYTRHIQAAEASTELGFEHDKAPRRPGLSWAEFRKSCEYPLGVIAAAAVACILLAAMKLLGPQQ